MVFFIGNEKVDLSKNKLDDLFVNKGFEGSVYVYKKEAIKLYSDKLKYRKKLTESEVLKLRKIPTKRILLPVNPIYDEWNDFVGYSTEFKIEAPKEKIGLLPISYLKEQLIELKEDIKLLSERHVRMDDLNLGSLLMTQNGLFLCDPGAYRIDKNSSSEVLEKANIEDVNYFFLQLVFYHCLKLTKTEKEKLSKLFPIKEEYIGDRIDIQKPKQLVNSYFKSILK